MSETIACVTGTEDRYDRMTDQLRRLLDAVSVADPGDDLVAAATDDLAALADRFAARAAPLDAQVCGRLDLPGRGQALIPTLLAEQGDDNHVTGVVRFGWFHHGFDGNAHGGSVALFLEDLLGSLAARVRTDSRTAFIHVDYRAGTPIGSDLRVAAWFEEETGRKRHLRATLHHGETLCVEAHALCIELRRPAA
jgi:hypothetical protein